MTFEMTTWLCQNVAMVTQSNNYGRKYADTQDTSSSKYFIK